jgi:hypothetical protein
VTLRINEQDDLFSAHVTMAGFLSDDDPMIVFSREIFPLFSDECFIGIYADTGRGAISPALLAMVTILQYQEHLSDEEATEACVKRLDWKIALHLPIDARQQFDSSTLCRFRNRLKENIQSSIIFDTILEAIKKKGFIKNITNQRIDATHILSHVNRIATVDLLFKAVKSLIEEIKTKDAAYYAAHIPQTMKERYMNRFSSFGMSKDRRSDKMGEIVEDGLYIKSLLEKTGSKKFSDLTQLSIMETIFAENITIKKKAVKEKLFIEVEEIRSPKQTIFHPDDLSIKLGIKGTKNWVGSKCHIAETAVRGKVNFITGMIYQAANEGDHKIHEAYIDSNNKRGLKPEKIFTDQGYVSGKSIFYYSSNKQTLMGRISNDSSKKQHDFKLDKFTIDVQNKKALCPMNKRSEKYSLLKKGLIDIYFSRNDCSQCKNAQECIGMSTRNKKRIQVSPYHDYIKARRNFQKTNEFKQEMRVRAQIEGTISEMVRTCGLRYARYRGKDGHQLQFYLTGAALNVKRFIKAMTKGMDIKQAVH